MNVEFKNLRREEVANLSKEKQWIGNLDVAYRTIQRVISSEFRKTMPNRAFPKPSPIIVAPDSDFLSLIREGKKNTESKLSSHAAYVCDFGLIILPKNTAEMFQRGGIKRAAATCALAEECIHRATTFTTEEGNLTRMGFYDLGGVKRVENNYEDGAIYTANLDFFNSNDEQQPIIPEAHGNSEVILTENATKFVVFSLARELSGAILNNNNLIFLSSRDKKDNVYGVTIQHSRKISERVYKAMATGDPGLLDMRVQSVLPEKTDVNIKDWLSKTDLKIFLIDPKMRTKNPSIDIFSYQGSELYS